MGLAWQQGPLASGAVGRFLVSGLVSFEPDKVEVHLDGARLRLEPGQSVIPHGADRDLTTDELAPGRQA
jgi:hypothetical protein